MANQEEWAGQVAASEGKAHIRDCAQHVISKHAHDESESCKADVDVACGNRGARTYSVGACGKTLGGDATQRPPHASQCGSAVPWGGKGAAALTGEVQRGKGRILLERSGQLLGPLVADLAAYGTRGAPAVGAASTCGKRSQAAQRNAPPACVGAAVVPWGVGGAPLCTHCRGSAW